MICKYKKRYNKQSCRDNRCNYENTVPSSDRINNVTSTYTLDDMGVWIFVNLIVYTGSCINIYFYLAACLSWNHSTSSILSDWNDGNVSPVRWILGRLPVQNPVRLRPFIPFSNFCEKVCLRSSYVVGSCLDNIIFRKNTLINKICFCFDCP